MTTTFTDWMERKTGTRNWVLARRTSRIVAKYGDDVKCLSSTEYRKLVRQFEIDTADDHPAAAALDKILTNSDYWGGYVVARLREAGFKIERVIE